MTRIACEFGIYADLTNKNETLILSRFVIAATTIASGVDSTSSEPVSITTVETTRTPTSKFLHHC